MTDSKKLFPLLIESIDHMKLTPSKKDFAKAVMRAAIEYAAMRQAGFVVHPAVAKGANLTFTLARSPQETQHD